MPAPEVIEVEKVLEASKGMLQKQLYVVFTEPVDGLGPILETLEEHLAFQTDLERRGILFAAGPLWTEDGKGWTGSGMVVVRAESLAAAQTIAEEDPMHRAGARRFTVRPWLINEGTITVKLNYAGKTFEIQ